MNQTELNAHRDLLAGSVVFRGLEDPALDQILKNGMLLEAKKGDLVLFEHARGGPGLYVVLEGQIEIFLSHDPAKVGIGPSEVYLNTLEPGHCFGEYSLIDGKETSASAKALKNTRLFFFPRGAFLRLVESDAKTGKSIYHNLLLYLIGRLRQKDKELDVLIMR